MNTRTILAIIFCIGLWGSAFVGIKIGLSAYQPMELALLRWSCAAIFLLMYGRFHGVGLPKLRDLPLITLMGLIGFTLYNFFLNKGQQTVDPGTASLLINTAPIFIALLATIFLHERMAWVGWLGVFISFIGAAIIATTKFGGSFKFEPAALLVLASAICAAIFSVTIKRKLLPTYGALRMTTYGIWTGTILMIPGGLDVIEQTRAAPLNVTLTVIYLGIFPGAIGYALWAYILSKIPAARATSFIYFMPVMTFIINWCWLGEKPKTLSLVGGAFAIAGVILVNTWGKVRAGPAPIPVE